MSFVQVAQEIITPSVNAVCTLDDKNYIYTYVDTGYGSPLQFALAMGQYQTLLRLIAIGREKELGISISENSGVLPPNPGECPGGYESDDDPRDSKKLPRLDSPSFGRIYSTASSADTRANNTSFPSANLSEAILKTYDDVIPENSGLFTPPKYSRKNPPPFPAFNVNPTPLHYGRSLLHEVVCLPAFPLQSLIASTLVRAGAKVNAVDDSGNTALLLAVEHGHADICRVLLRAGADVWRCNAEGVNAVTACLLSPISRYVDVYVACML